MSHGSDAKPRETQCLAELLTLYGEWLEGSTRNLRTLALYRQILGSIPPDLLERPDDAARGLRAHIFERYSTSTAFARLSCIRRCFRHWAERGFLPWSAVDLVRAGRPPRTSPPGLLTTDEIRKAATYVYNMREMRGTWPPLQRAALLWLHLHTGMRASEALFITAGEVNPEEGTVSLRDTPARSLKSRNAARTMPMTSTLRVLLGELCQGKPADARLFSGNKPTLFRLIHERGGVKVCPNIIRHTVATSLVQARLPLAAVAAWLGHSTIITTQTYYLNLRRTTIPGLEPETWQAFAVERFGFAAAA